MSMSIIVLPPQVAVKLTNLENHRTETDYENTLIFKTFLFQFANSYTALFYIAFVKGTNVSPFNTFGLTDANGNPYRDACGKRGTESYESLDCADPDDPATCRYVFVTDSCIDTLRSQMLFYTILKPCYEIPLQVLSSREAPLQVLSNRRGPAPGPIK